LKPLVFTTRSARELSNGLTLDLVSASPVLQMVDEEDATYLIHIDDLVEDQRIYMARDKFARDPLAPPYLARNRRESYGRIAAFAERASNGPLSLPKGWGQYKVDNFVAFAALPISNFNDIRWYAEVLPEQNFDVYLWITVDNPRLGLADYIAENQNRNRVSNSGWSKALGLAQREFEVGRLAATTDVDITFSPLNSPDGTGWDFETWFQQASAEQRNFIETKTDRSIRLRGPAGSGKTLALTLKAIRELRLSSESERPVRVLFVTHSWSLANQVQRSIDAMGESHKTLDVFPLVAVAQDLMPQQFSDGAVSLIGEDSLSGKRAQLDEIQDVLDDFIASDWVAFKSKTSPGLADRIQTKDPDKRLAFLWDLLIEFGSVIGALNIYPGAGSEQRYLQMVRAPWMLPVETKSDMKVIFDLYSRYVRSLEDRGLLTADQLLSDFVNYLESHAWNRRRKTEGYDLIFVDEFHLFSPLERQVLHYLNSDVTIYPRLFMAADPGQSPSAELIGAASAATQSSELLPPLDTGDYRNFDLKEIHRFTPEILDLIRHVHLAFPTLVYGQDWDIDFSRVESVAARGPKPSLIRSEDRDSEAADLYSEVQDLHSAGTVGIAIVDSRQWTRYSEFASNLSKSGKFGVNLISSRSDIGSISYRQRGVVIGAAEHLAGLQFNAILVVGLPDMRPGAISPAERTRLLSMLYLSISRAERNVAIITNDEDGGVPEVLLGAISQGLMVQKRGTSIVD